jgi:hypothetical protein
MTFEHASNDHVKRKVADGVCEIRSMTRTG